MYKAFLPLSKEVREHIWRTSDNKTLIGDHPESHELLARYEATVQKLEKDLDSLRLDMVNEISERMKDLIAEVAQNFS